MRKLLASNAFWALPAARTEMILRELALGQGANDVPAKGKPAGAMEVSSAEGTALVPALPSALGTDRAEGPVRVIPVDGVLSVGGHNEWWGVGYGWVKRQIQAALDDPTVKAILLDIDSPGGTVNGCQELGDFVASAAKQKPMAAFTTGMMASAAYWVGSATGRVLCTETADVGSIGVVCTRYDFTGANAAWGVKVHVLTSGKYKSLFNSNVPMSEEEREILQARAEATHEVFRRSVREAMGLESPAEEWGDAQLFLGAEALNVGLASAVVSGLDEAVTMLESEVTMNRAELEAKHPELVKELLAEGYAKAVTERSFTAETFLSCVKPFMKEADHAKAAGFFEKCSAAKMTPEQMAAVSSAMSAFVAVPQEEKKEDDAKGDGGKAAILAELQDQQGKGVPADTSNPDAKAALREARRKLAANM